MRAFWITVGVVLVLLAAVFIGSSLWIGSYIRSDSFRSLIAEATGKTFDATAAFDPLRWTGASVYSESAHLVGASGALKGIEASRIRANLNWRAAFSGVWRVEEISIARLDGEWTPGSNNSDLTAARGGSSDKTPAFVSSVLPHRFELGQLNIGSANLSFGPLKISDSSLTVKPDGSAWVFQGSGGELRLPWPPPLSITTFRAREQGGGYYLTQGNFRIGKAGKVTASGDSTAGGKIQMGWEDIASADVLPVEWRRRIDGTLSGSADITFPDRAAGSFLLRDGRLDSIPLLATVADFTGNPAFRRMPLHEVSGDFNYSADTLRVKNFIAESKGLMRLEGTLMIGKGGALEGHFEIGVTPQTLQWLPGSRERVFRADRNGYLWTGLVVGGTLDHPTENLSARLLTAMGTEVIETGAGLLKDTPGAAVEGAKGVIDLLRPLIP